MARNVSAIVPLLELVGLEEPATGIWMSRGYVLLAAVDVAKAKGM